jgi:hypothetical protein
VGGHNHEVAIYKTKGLQSQRKIYGEGSEGEGSILCRGKFHESPEDFLLYEYKQG